MNKKNVTAVVIAAALADRMNSKKSKLFHNICGRPLAAYALDAAQAVTETRPVFITDIQEDALEEAFGDRAFYAGLVDGELLPPVALSTDGLLVVVYADMPLVDSETIEKMLDTVSEKDIGACALLGEDEMQSSGSAYCFKIPQLKKAIEAGCSTFSDCVEYFADNGYGADAIYSEKCFAVTDRAQLSLAGAHLRRSINEKLMNEGVTIIDPENTYIDAEVEIGMDTVVFPGVTIEGSCEVGQDCTLYPGSRIADSIIGNGTTVQNAVITQAQVGDNTTVGPYAYLRPNAVIGNGCKVGDFVEVKNAVMKDGAKASHLTYIGDGEVGEKSNIGCGVIFCNYDGKKKSRTVVGKNVFIGSNSNLVAPVNIQDGAFVAAGTTVTEDVEKDALCIGRSRQKIISGWAKKWWGK